MLLDELTAEQLEEQAEELQRRGFHPGYDGMSAQAAALWLRLNAGTLLRQLKRERYVPSPVVGFHVAKQDGSSWPWSARRRTGCGSTPSLPSGVPPWTA